VIKAPFSFDFSGFDPPPIWYPTHDRMPIVSVELVHFEAVSLRENEDQGSRSIRSESRLENFFPESQVIQVAEITPRRLRQSPSSPIIPSKNPCIENIIYQENYVKGDARPWTSWNS